MLHRKMKRTKTISMIDFQVFAKRGRLVDLGFASLVFVLIGVLMVVLAPQTDKPAKVCC